MRALSVRQPWAELIALGKKRIEAKTHARTPVIFAGGDPVSSARTSRVGRAAGAEDIARAVHAALAAE